MNVKADTSLTSAIDELITANHILAHEGVLDAYGHVSIRHPQDPTRFFLSCSRSPQLVSEKDIMEFGLDGEPIGPDDRSPYVERFIHAGIYQARADIHAVVHSHAEDVLPFTITRAPLRPVLQTATVCGKDVPLWDIHDEFGDTNLLVGTLAQGHSLARRLGENRMVLMRGHGFAAGAGSLFFAVSMSIYLPLNARVLMNASKLGDVTYVSAGEIAKSPYDDGFYPRQVPRAWEYWQARADAARTLTEL